MRVEVFYTGGGIWVAQKHLQANEFAVISSDAVDYFAIYNQEEDDGQYYPEDMILNQHKDELDAEHRQTYEELLLALRSKSPEA